MGSLIPLLIAILGGLGLVLALPGRQTTAQRVGIFLLAAAGGVLAYLLTRLLSPYVGSGQEYWFVVLSLIGLAGAIAMITAARPVYSALFFVLVIVATTGLALLAEAEFLAGALLIIYAGAIIVTYVFVIMLAKQTGGPSPYDRRARMPFLGTLIGFVLLGMLSHGLLTLPLGEGNPPPTETVRAVGSPERIGALLLTDYIVAIQIAGVILMAAMIGAVAVARRRPQPHEEVEL